MISIVSNKNVQYNDKRAVLLPFFGYVKSHHKPLKRTIIISVKDESAQFYCFESDLLLTVSLEYFDPNFFQCPRA